MKKINKLAFGEEDISLHDALWFYGEYAVMGAAALFALSTIF